MRRSLFCVSVLIFFCLSPFHLAWSQGQIAPVQDGGTTCTVKSSRVDEPDRTIITQTITCDDGTSQVCTIVITSSSTSRTCSNSSASNPARGCAINA
jgi:hypothetical protein